MTAGSISEETLSSTLTTSLSSHEVDEDIVNYLATMLCDLTTSELASGNTGQDNPVYEAMQPFLESSGVSSDGIDQACAAVASVAQAQLAKEEKTKTVRLKPSSSSFDTTSSSTTTNNNDSNNNTNSNDAVRLSRGFSMMDDLKAQTESEAEANRYLWGGEGGVQANANESREQYKQTNSAKERRKARQELEKARREYEAKMKILQAEEQETSGKAVAAMVLPDYQSGRNDKDIQVKNVSLSLDSGAAILDDAELKFAQMRRYGLVGKNGIGKTTLLKAIARMEIPGFPRHHRVLHVRQEVSMGHALGPPPPGMEAKKAEEEEEKAAAETKKTDPADEAAGGPSVLQLVIDSDAERNALIAEEKQITARLEVDKSQDQAQDAAQKRQRLQALRAAKKTGSKKSNTAEDDDEDEAFQKDLKRLDEIYNRLSVIGADSAEARAATILSGLQFTPDMQRGPMSALSGGWRMRVSLAAALFIEPDLLMLDEPTNHLDLEACLWLASYLTQYKYTVIVVSHDRGFLNEVCTDIIHFANRTLTYYRGNFDTYLKTSDEQIKNAMRRYQAYQDKRAHMMEFIDKFRCNAKRATLVQSRIKAVEKMDAEAPEEVVVEPIWRFSIPNPEPLGRPIIMIDDATFDYSMVRDDGTKKAPEEFLLQKVNFGVDLESRIGILGANGAGKSTLLNLIMDKIQPVRGSISRNPHLRIGHFTQHSADKFDLQLSSVENMMQLYDKAMDQEMRSFLGKFQIQGTDALKPMMMLSGGQKSRVAFAALAYQKPHVIIMDEPTNHLDVESIDALVEAVSDFRGGLMVVSHDQFFITKTCTELWVVGEGKATHFGGDFELYKKHTLERTAKRVAESVKALSTMSKS